MKTEIIHTTQTARTAQTTAEPFIFTVSNVSPINDIAMGIEQGHYGNRNVSMDKKSVPLKRTRGVKTLYIVLPGRVMEQGELAELLFARNMQFCAKAPNYLLGAMAWLSPHEISSLLYDKDIVALEPGNRHAIFTVGPGRGPHLLRVSISCDGEHRYLGMTPLKSDMKWLSRHAFLAECLPVQPADRNVLSWFRAVVFRRFWR